MQRDLDAMVIRIYELFLGLFNIDVSNIADTLSQILFEYR